MSVSEEKNGKTNETPFSCEVCIDRQKITLSWAKSTGVCVAADIREGNCVIQELYKVLKENNGNEFWKICV
jgi:hypothetical protein